MSRNSLVRLCCLMTFSLALNMSLGAVVKVSGAISQDTIWNKAGGPYLVQGDLVIKKGATLALEAGTVVYLLADASGDKGSHSTERVDIIVEGTLEAKGTAASPIYFAPAKQGSYWGAISFRDAKGESSMEFCWVAGGGIICENASPYFIACGITKCQTGLVVFGASRPRLTKTRFIGNRSAVILTHKKASLSMANCELSGNGYGLVLREFNELDVKSNRLHKNQLSVVNMTQQEAELAGNWWGSDEDYAIAKAIHDGEDDPKLGRVNFLPLYGQSAAEAEAVAALRADQAKVDIGLEVSDWEYSVPTAGRGLFSDPEHSGQRKFWKLMVVVLGAGGTYALLLLL